MTAYQPTFRRNSCAYLNICPCSPRMSTAISICCDFSVANTRLIICGPRCPLLPPRSPTSPSEARLRCRHPAPVVQLPAIAWQAGSQHRASMTEQAREVIYLVDGHTSAARGAYRNVGWSSLDPPSVLPSSNAGFPLNGTPAPLREHSHRSSRVPKYRPEFGRGQQASIARMLPRASSRQPRRCCEWLDSTAHHVAFLSHGFAVLAGKSRISKEIVRNTRQHEIASLRVRQERFND